MREIKRFRIPPKKVPYEWLKDKKMSNVERSISHNNAVSSEPKIICFTSTLIGKKNRLKSVSDKTTNENELIK